MPAVIAEALAMKGPRPTSSGSGSSSGEEDGDAEWKAAIQSIAAATTATFTPIGFNTSFSNSSTTTTTTKAKTTRNNSVSRPTPDTLDDDADDGEKKQQPQKLKHFQIKAQKLLDEMLEKSLVIVKDANNVPDDDSVENEGGVRLFKNSALGIVFDCGDDIQRPTKRPKILPGTGIDENSKETTTAVYSSGWERYIGCSKTIKPEIIS
ncbi:uncharacterized protein LOC110409070 isoform X3 [Herrania umbratica]|uniref:Uncharacterized protein LOC110409070 isoform X3 n=1 Tax=Herrania umbratica TaxID=108875 RepID=A0A6J0ZGA8_9ROSI|nr:uncharacterized protein LOC110409070 isoform X3 [Herrania umbratica]